MHTDTDRTVQQLIISILEDFRSPLEGPFHRGGPRGLSFSVVRSPEDNKICGFRIVTGGSEWQERLSTVRTINGTDVWELTVSDDEAKNPEEQRLCRVWMDMETLEHLHRMAKQYIEDAEASRNRSGRLAGEASLYGQSLETALSCYHKAAPAINCGTEC